MIMICGFLMAIWISLIVIIGILDKINSALENKK